MTLSRPNDRLPSRAGPSGPADTGGVFLPMAAPYRIGVVAYLVLYHLIFPVFAVGGDAGPLVIFRFLSEALLVGLLALPFLVMGRQGGWLHPLMLPGVLMIAKAVFKDPMALLNPIASPMVDLGAGTQSWAASLRLSDMDLELNRIGLTLVGCLGLAIYYAAFFATRRFRLPPLPLAPGRNVPALAFAVVGTSVVAALILFSMSGGLSSYLVSMRGGRFAIFAEIGPVLQVITFATTVVTIWLMYERRPFLNPIFVGSVLAALMVALLATGSRSGAVIPAVTLLMLWWAKRGGVRLVPALVAAALAYAVIGGFGAIRQDYGSRTVDLSVLSPSNLGTWFSSSTEETARRDDTESDLAAFVGANEAGLLWGRTYVYAVSFWIPRGLWPDKPRAADSYNMWINFVGNPVDAPLPQLGQRTLYGIPVSARVEAYWNFHLLGVILLAIGMGLFHRALVVLAQTYRHVPAVLPIVVFATISFTGSSKEFVNLARDTAFLIPFLLLSGILVWGRRPAAFRRGAGAAQAPQTGPAPSV